MKCIFYECVHRPIGAHLLIQVYKHEKQPAHTSHTHTYLHTTHTYHNTHTHPQQTTQTHTYPYNTHIPKHTTVLSTHTHNRHTQTSTYPHTTPHTQHKCPAYSVSTHVVLYSACPLHCAVYLDRCTAGQGILCTGEGTVCCTHNCKPDQAEA